jgi:hypothetical protein
MERLRAASRQEWNHPARGQTSPLSNAVCEIPGAEESELVQIECVGLAQVENLLS